MGINLAVQNAVAAANILVARLRTGTEADLATVQARRNFPTRVTQRLQLILQERVIGRVLAADKPLRAPWAMRLLSAAPWLRCIPARMMGLGVRPAHVRYKT